MATKNAQPQYLHLGCCPYCRKTDVCVASYRVGSVNIGVTVVFDTDTGEPSDVEFNRHDGDISEVELFCNTCGANFTLDDILAE